jgi:hypothetical protein
MPSLSAAPRTPFAGSPSVTPAATPRASMPTPAAGRPGTPTPSAGGKKPVNPFLANDPNLKARRLARALVSDMIAYMPGKREEALAAGTIKTVFKEEIKKSYEEYVDQIGKEFADSTNHFQDALNDLLGGGQKLF